MCLPPSLLETSLIPRQRTILNYSRDLASYLLKIQIPGVSHSQIRMGTETQGGSLTLHFLRNPPRPPGGFVCQAILGTPA